MAETSEIFPRRERSLKYTLEAVGDRIDDFLRTLLVYSGLELNFQIEEGGGTHPEIENPDITVRFSGADIDLLLANKAELLLALEQLTMEMMRMPSEHHSLVCFDANDYRMMRMEELRLTALAAADRVKRARTPFFFSPMTSRERRIVHLALRDETELRSESVGMGPYRQVVVLPKDMPMPPQPPPPRYAGPPRSGPPHFGPPRSGPPGRGGRPPAGRGGQRR